MFQKVKLPKAGCHRSGLAALWSLDVTVGERHEDSTDLIVRGRATTYDKVRKCLVLERSWPFAGTIVLREGRDDVDHDLVVYGQGSTPAAFTDELATLVSLALDEYSDVTAKEMERICG